MWAAMHLANLHGPLERLGVLPIVTAHTVAGTVELAKTLVANGVPCMEIACRTDCAIDAAKAVKETGIDILLGMGMVTSTSLLEQISGIGVDFVVSPGVTSKLLYATNTTRLPLLPGVNTASEIMLCMEYDITYMKMYLTTVPIDAMQLLETFYRLFPEIQFCPTGGINTDNMQDFMKLPNVFCVGGSWIVPDQLIVNNEWDAIAQLCKKTMGLIANS